MWTINCAKDGNVYNLRFIVACNARSVEGDRLSLHWFE